MFWAEAIARTVKVLREILYSVDIGTNRVLRLVATLELVQHQLSEMGHSDLLVTQTLHAQQCWGRQRGSVRRASGLVQTRLSSLIPGSSATRKLARNRLLASRQTINANSSSYRLRAAFAHNRRRMEWLVA